MSDYIKRLEKAVQKPAGPGGIIRIKKADLRSLLSDVERMRGALEELLETVDAQVRVGMVWDPGTVSRARQALSAHQEEQS